MCGCVLSVTVCVRVSAPVRGCVCVCVCAPEHAVWGRGGRGRCGPCRVVPLGRCLLRSVALKTRVTSAPNNPPRPGLCSPWGARPSPGPSTPAGSAPWPLPQTLGSGCWTTGRVGERTSAVEGALPPVGSGCLELERDAGQSSGRGLLSQPSVLSRLPLPSSPIDTPKSLPIPVSRAYLARRTSGVCVRPAGRAQLSWSASHCAARRSLYLPRQLRGEGRGDASPTAQGRG